MKKIWKKWWFWIIIAVMVIAFILFSQINYSQPTEEEKLFVNLFDALEESLG